MDARRLQVKHKFLYLLISLILFLVLNPFLAESRLEWDNYIFSILFTLVLIFSVYAVEHKRYVLVAAILLAFLVFSGHWILVLLNLSAIFYVIDYLMTVIFFLLITVLTIRKIISDSHITANTLYGAISSYLLLGLIWSFAYMIIYLFDQQAFQMPVITASAQIVDARIQRFIYYSFVTLSTLGYGDIVPLTNVAKTFSWMEAVTGQIYLTVWIAHLVGMYVANKQRGHNK